MSDGVGRVLFDSNGNAIKVTQDGSDYKYEFLGKLRNAAGTIVNPATEDTLTAADTKLGTIDGVLDSIKDTDGIKKITDELPAGTQEIGSVAQGTKAAGSGAWPTAVYDENGNAITIFRENNGHFLGVKSDELTMLLNDIKSLIKLMSVQLKLITDDDLQVDDLEDEGLI